jgi:hypothetical protein
MDSDRRLTYDAHAQHPIAVRHCSCEAGPVLEGQPGALCRGLGDEIVSRPRVQDCDTRLSRALGPRVAGPRLRSS